MSDHAWHVLEGNASVGPMSTAQLLRMFFSGRYAGDTMVWHEHAADWRRLDEAVPLEEVTPPPLPTGALGTVNAQNEANVEDATIAVPDARNIHWRREPAYAWRRYFARQFDILIYALFVFFLLGAILAADDSAYTLIFSKTNGIVLNILGIVLGIVPSAIVLGFTGRSLGKLLFGLKVLDAEGRPPGLWRGLRREAQVIFQGLGAGIPVVSLFTLIGGYTSLHDKGASGWDAGNGLTTWYRKPSLIHWLLMLLGIGLWLGLFSILIAIGQNHA